MWISAPGGYGKTTLAAGYLVSRKLPCIWYRFYEGDDSDAASFFYYMSLAFKNAFPGSKINLPILTPDLVPGVSVFTRRYFEKLMVSLETPFAMVFDNYHHVEDGPLFNLIFQNIIEAVPKGVKIIVCSRNPYPRQFSRFYANNDMSLIEEKSLRFSLDESREMMKLLGRTKASTEEVEEVYRRSAGWAAGLVLILKGSSKAVSHYGTENLFNYFASEIFDRIGPELREFLMKTSFSAHTNSDMAVKLTGNKKAAHILAMLVDEHVFVEENAHADPGYTYHPLFREVLMDYAKKSMTSGDLEKTLRLTASYLENSGEVEEAGHIYVELKDGPALTRLVNLNAAKLLGQGRGETVEKWLKAIPEKDLSAAPGLYVWRGYCRLSASTSEARGYFKKAFKSYEITNDCHGQFSAWCDIVGTFLFENDDLSDLAFWIDWFYENYDSGRSPASAELQLSVAANIAGALILVMPWRVAEIEKWLLLGMEIEEKCNDIEARVKFFLQALKHLASTGDLCRITEIISKIKLLTKNSGATIGHTLIWKYMEAGFHTWYSGNLTAAEKILDEALILADKSGAVIYRGMLYAIGACIELNAGDLHSGRKYIDMLNDMLTDDMKPKMMHSHYLYAWYWLLAGELNKAENHCRIAIDIAGETNYIIPEAMGRAALAMIMYKAGNLKEAKKLLLESKKNAGKTQHCHIEIMCHIGEAVVAFDGHEESRGISSLKKALSIMRGKGHFGMLWWWQPDVMALVCEKALENGVEEEYVVQLIRKRGIVPNLATYYSSLWPWPLKIYTLSRFRIIKDGKVLQFKGKSQKKPVELLKVIISLGGRDVSEEKLWDILWPDSDGDAAHSSFSSAMHRLRRIIGHEKAIVVHEGYVTLDPRYCWVDAYCFERAAGQIDSLRQSDDLQAGTPVAIQMAKGALALYFNSFLSRDDAIPWVEDYRERLNSKFLKLLKRTGHYYENEGLFQEAIDIYEKGIAVDSTSEELYRRAMACHFELGNNSEVIKIYNLCQKMLSSVYYSEPSCETKKIFQSAKSSPQK